VPDVLKLPAIKEPLRIKEVTSKNPEVAELGKVEEVVAELAPAKPDPHAKKKPDPSPQAYGLAWAIKDDVAVLGAGEDPARVLASLGKVLGQEGQRGRRPRVRRVAGAQGAGEATDVRPLSGRARLAIARRTRRPRSTANVC
jgi:hypothetical protein